MNAILYFEGTVALGQRARKKSTPNGGKPNRAQTSPAEQSPAERKPSEHSEAMATPQDPEAASRTPKAARIGMFVVLVGAAVRGPKRCELYRNVVKAWWTLWAWRFELCGIVVEAR